MDLEDKHSVIENLETFLSEKQEQLNNILSVIEWSEDFLTSEDKVQCPCDPNHWVPESRLEKHVEKCSWTKEGYVSDEFNSQCSSSDFFYQKASSVVSVTIDKEKQYNILKHKGLLSFDKQNFELPDIPKTIDRSCTELNPDQRLALYDHVVQEGESMKQSKNVTLEDLMFDFEKKNDQDGKPKTALEILAEQRDYKRRRQSYRAKNVHITKKSYTEVMKEVIENQISYLAESRKQEFLENEGTKQLSANNSEDSCNDTDAVNSHRSKRSNHRHSRCSESRSASPKKHKHKRKRSRSRDRHKHKKSHKHKKNHD